MHLVVEHGVPVELWSVPQAAHENGLGPPLGELEEFLACLPGREQLHPLIRLRLSLGEVGGANPPVATHTRTPHTHTQRTHRTSISGL